MVGTVTFLSHLAVQKSIESQEEGHVKTIKRTIEEVAVEAPPFPSPLKIQKAPVVEPSSVAPQPLPSEPIAKEEAEVRQPPGKLTKVWPPPATESENRVPKIDTSVEITSNNVSSIISSFSTVTEEEAFTSHPPPRQVTRPQQVPQVAEMMDIDLQPEPAPEYGIVEPQPMQEEPQITVEETPAPEPEPEAPAFLESELQMMEEYQRMPVPTLETHKVLSPVPEAESEPAPSPEPPRIPTPEPPKIPTPEPPKIPTPEPPKEPTPEPPRVPTPQPIVPVLEPPPAEPQTIKEEKTETSTIETNVMESKKSMSKTSYSVVETKVYTTGGVTSPLPEEVQAVTEVVDTVVQPLVSEMVVQEAAPEPEPMIEARAEPIVVDDLMQYFVPETEQVIEFIPPPKPAEPTPSPEPPPVTEQTRKEEFFSSSSSSQAFTSMKSEMKTMYVSNVTNVEMKATPQPTAVFEPAQQEKPQPKLLQPLIMPEPLSQEPLSGDEAVRPPKPPEKDDGRESRKPKKKRESVIQIAKRLEENIVPMSPDEVPGGIRMFPSPKQPSTPVLTTPTKEVEPLTAEEKPTLETFLQLEPFPFTVEEKPKRERPRSLPPPMPSKFVPGTFTDSEYDSDFDTEYRFQFKKIKFEVPERAPRSQSAGKEPLPPSAFDKPPVIDSLRPEIVKPETTPVPVKEKEKPKPKPAFVPKKKAKIVEKFLSSAGETEEKDIIKPVPMKPKVQETVAPAPTPPKVQVQEKKETVVKSWPPKPEVGETKQMSVSSSFETRTQVMSVSQHSQVSQVSTVQQQPQPVFELQPEPEPVYEVIPEPEPVYEPVAEPEPIYEPIAEPEPVLELKPEPAPVYETIPEPAPPPAPVPEPEPVYETIPEPAVPKVIPKFRPVQAPVAKPSPVKASPAPPPPPFDMVPPAPQPIVAQTQQASVSRKVEEHVSTTKKVESKVSSSFVTKSFNVQKKTPAWPPSPKEEVVTVAPTFKTRSLSAERPRVTEPVTLPPSSFEAPAIYWTSSVTLKEKRKSWPPPAQETPITSTIMESTMQTSKQETKQISKQTTQTEKKQIVKETYTPPVHIPVKPFKPAVKPVAAAPPPPVVESVPAPCIPLPPLEPFPFKVSPEREKKPRGPPPPMPSKFIPGSFTESEYESDYDAKSSASRLYMSDSEAAGYKPLNLKLKKGRSRRPKQPSPPAPTTFGPPLPFEVKPMCVSFSDIEYSDFPTSRESTPVLETKVTKVVQSRAAVHELKTLASEILPEHKPIRIAQSTSQQKVQTVASQPAPIVTPTAAPVVTPQPVKEPPAPVVVPQPEPPAPLLTTASSETVTKKEVKQVTSESQIQVTEKQERGVRGMKKMFDVSGPPPMPQGIAAAPIRVQSPSPVRAVPAVVRPVAPTAVAPLQAPAPAAPPSSAVVTNIPVVQEFSSVEKTSSSSSSTTRAKPTSPKAKKKAEATQMVVREQEESGYTADTEGTLPRRTAKTAQSSVSSSFQSSSTSFAKSESFVSSSFTSESKSFSSSQMGSMEASSFPMGSGFPSSNGLVPDSFPFPTPAPPVGQTTQFSSSCKSSESKSSQVRKAYSPTPHSVCWQ